MCWVWSETWKWCWGFVSRTWAPNQHLRVVTRRVSVKSVQEYVPSTLVGEMRLKWARGKDEGSPCGCWWLSWKKQHRIAFCGTTLQPVPLVGSQASSECSVTTSLRSTRKVVNRGAIQDISREEPGNSSVSVMPTFMHIGILGSPRHQIIACICTILQTLKDTYRIPPILKALKSTSGLPTYLGTAHLVEQH